MSASATARVYPALFFAVLLVAVGAISFVVLAPFLVPIGWAIVLAVALWPLWDGVRRRFPRRRTVVAAVAATLVALLVLLPAGLLLGALFAQASQAASRLGLELKSRNVRSFADLVSLPSVAKTLDGAAAAAGISPVELQQKASDLLSRGSQLLATKGGDLFLGIVGTVLTFLTTMFLLFFFLRDGEGMVKALTDLLPLGPKERARVMGSLGGMLQSIFKGSLLCALVQGASGGVAWAIVGLPAAAVAGAAMAMLSLLPIGGTAIIWGPGCIVLWVSGRHGAAIFLALWGAIVTSFLADNVLKPLLIGRAEELNTLLVFLGVFGGLAAFGLPGLFLGPMALAVFTMLLGVLRTKAREARGETATSGA